MPEFTDIVVKGTATVSWADEKPEDDHPSHPDEISEEEQEKEEEE